MTDESLSDRSNYKIRYIADVEEFLAAILNKTVVPHQVEVQPGRLDAKSICWMTCSYCYGGSASHSSARLSRERLKAVVAELARGPHGGVRKVIFAGYATDPLNYQHIDELVETARANQQIVGVHTKALKVSDQLIETLTSSAIQRKSYFTVSIDAGSSDIYNAVHDLAPGANVYPRILENLRRLISSARDHSKLDISASYLITRLNDSPAEVEKSIDDLLATGVGLIRFSFPQAPRGFESADGTIILSPTDTKRAVDRLGPLVEARSSVEVPITLWDPDREHESLEARTLPCVARFLFPAIGFDGHLYHCSQSSSPQFHDMALGGLAERGFWDLFYDYDPEALEDYWDWFEETARRLDCRCDRKEHIVNSQIRDHVSSHGV
jgi:MoaA/NifB/PqqE/SkfB family radical SAM enzyme